MANLRRLGRFCSLKSAPNSDDSGPVFLPSANLWPGRSRRSDSTVRLVPWGCGQSEWQSSADLQPIFSRSSAGLQPIFSRSSVSLQAAFRLQASALSLQDLCPPEPAPPALKPNRRSARPAGDRPNVTFRRFLAAPCSMDERSLGRYVYLI